MDDLKAKIRDDSRFSEAGHPVLRHHHAAGGCRGFRDAVDALAAPYIGEDSTRSIGIESRGFILGAAVATARLRLRAGAQAGKLPATIRELQPEYGNDTLEIHEDASRGQRS